jgi:uncharacterized beta-barrel protein YwiB (DUF1934 family)
MIGNQTARYVRSVGTLDLQSTTGRMIARGVQGVVRLAIRTMIGNQTARYVRSVGTLDLQSTTGQMIARGVQGVVRPELAATIGRKLLKHALSAMPLTTMHFSPRSPRVIFKLFDYFKRWV